MRVLVTGAAGYIGSHVVKALAVRGHQVVALDRDASSPNWDFVHRHSTWTTEIDLRNITSKGVPAYYDAVVHLAADISVEESARDPLKYWDNNVGGLSALLKNVATGHFILASTGTAFQPANAYAWSKVACEQMVQEFYEAGRLDGTENMGGYTIFRFYNVSGLGEGVKPTGQPTHLIRLAAMAARGLRPELKVFGTDWETPDGTCVRDYIHVEDIAASIAAAVVRQPANSPYECLGSGSGYTVLEVVQSMKEVSGVDFRVTMAPRRPGDVAQMLCPDHAKYAGLQLTRSLNDMCFSAYMNV